MLRQVIAIEAKWCVSIARNCSAILERLTNARMTCCDKSFHELRRAAGSLERAVGAAGDELADGFVFALAGGGDGAVEDELAVE